MQEDPFNAKKYGRSLKYLKRKTCCVHSEVSNAHFLLRVCIHGSTSLLCAVYDWGCISANFIIPL